MNPQDLLHFLLTSIDSDANNMRMHAVSAYTSADILVFLNSVGSSYNATDRATLQK